MKGKGKKVMNLRHEDIAMEGSLARHLIQLLDGSRDRAALLDDLSQLVERGNLTVQAGGESISDLAVTRHTLATDLEHTLAEIGTNALLTA